jgi:hypothetical protein
MAGVAKEMALNPPKRSFEARVAIGGARLTAAKTVWIVECKWQKRGRHWEPSLDHVPFTHAIAAQKAAAARQDEKPGWQYRAVPYVRVG